MIIWIWSGKYFYAEHNPTIRADKNGNVYGGGGGTEINYPSQPQPSTAEAVEAYVENLPAMYEAQMQYSPLIAAQQVGMLQEYLPGIVGTQQQLQQQYLPQNVAQQVGLQMAYSPMLVGQQQELQRMYEPEAYAAKSQLGELMSPDYLTSYTPQTGIGFDAVKDRLREDVRGAWASRGLAESGMSAEDEARMLAEFEFPYALQKQQLANQELGRRQDVALSLAGRYGVQQTPTVNMPNVGIPGYTAPDLMSGYNFPNVANFMQQGYGNYVGGAMATQSPNYMGGIGSILQGTGAFFSSIRFKKNVRLWA
jgi:hypothetical protein